MKLYAGIDLHSNNSYVVVSDEQDKVMFQKRFANNASLILGSLESYREQIQGVVVESTYNWYWLVDELQRKSYKVHLANTAAMQKYCGMKHENDKTDARWLAKMLCLKILPEGHIYPKEQRGLRELLRRRLVLVRQQTMCLMGIQAMVVRYENIKCSASNIKKSKGNEEKILGLLKDENARAAAQSQLAVLHVVGEQIAVLEKNILAQIKEDALFQALKKIPGIGPILAMTILLETGDIKRFDSAGNYSSYCRCVESKRESNAKKKGENNRKNGNAYLGWAFIEAANFSIRSYEPIKKYYQRKVAKTKRVVALKTIANKLAKACYFILRDNVEFDMKKLFG